MVNSRSVDELHPFVKELLFELRESLEFAGLEYVISSTYRDAEYQNRLYEIGRTRELKRRPVTWVRGGDSYHQWRVAFDVLLLDGKTVLPDNSPDWDKLGELGEALGLTWGGRFKSVDKPHFQYDAGLAIQQFKAGWSIDNDGNAVAPMEGTTA